MSMTSRQRIEAALNHRQPDRLPLDLGASNQTGMCVSSVYRLRQALKLDPPGTPVKVIDIVQMLGEIAPDLQDALDVDAVALCGPNSTFGFPLSDWKPWTAFDGTPVLVPGKFNTDPEPNGDILLYPEGDKTAPASGRMPKGGFYFDVISRQQPFEEESLKVEDNLVEYAPVSDATLQHFASEADRLAKETDRAIVATFGGTAFGSLTNLLGPALKHPKGIRDVTEWYMSTSTRFDFVHEMFDRQCDIALTNLAKYYDAVGDRVSVIFVTATDLGTQNAPIMSPNTYRKLYKPFHRRVNDWVHQRTPWKTFTHSCGAIFSLIPDLIDAGFDILNPGQCWAVGMDPQKLKDTFGDKITFWVGGINTQKTLPFGTPDDIRREVRERIEIFNRGGGFVFNTVHNVQAGVPAENLLALYEAVNESR